MGGGKVGRSLLGDLMRGVLGKGGRKSDGGGRVIWWVWEVGALEIFEVRKGGKGGL